MPKSHLILLHAPSNYDFRRRPILYGPISDLIPPTSIFEMYPIGFVSIGAYLEHNGFHTRIINIANRMLQSRKFNVEKFISNLSSNAFGIDLHWLPHAHGSLEIARIVKKYHPSAPVIFGGLSSSYFHEELIKYPQVDFVVRGDSAEVPMAELMKRLRDKTPFDDVPNLSWKDDSGVPHHNPLTWVPGNLNGVPLDYDYPTKSVLKYRDLSSIIPFKNWLKYPITMALSCRGCTHNCVTCGGSEYAYRNSYQREQPAYRSPRLIARDVRSIQRYLSAPVFIIGDIRQSGDDYADELLSALRAEKGKGQIVLELFAPASRQFFQKVKSAIPKFNIQMSVETHDEEVRKAFGKGYKNRDMEETIKYALEAGCQRFDLFFMTGLPKQDYNSVMDTAGYCDRLLTDLDGDQRLHPYISPMAPFLDPGSMVFENPQAFGYTSLFRSLEEHRQALLNPSWKYMLSYETQWMSRGEIVESAYQVALAFNAFKRKHGLVSARTAEEVEQRGRDALSLIEEVDRLVKQGELELGQERMTQTAALSISATCEKRELEWPAVSFLRNVPRILRATCTRI